MMSMKDNFLKLLERIILINNDNLCCLAKDKSCYNENVDVSITSLSKGKVGTVYLLSNGKVKNALKVTNKVSLNKERKISVEPPSNTININNINTGCLGVLDDLSIKNYEYLGLDEFSNESVIAYIIDQEFITKELPDFYVRHFSSFICSNRGYNLMEYCDLGTCVDFATRSNTSKYRELLTVTQNESTFVTEVIKEEDCFEIIKQVIIGLYLLTNTLQFTSGDLKAANVFIKTEPINVIYDGILINSQYRCKIADYGKSTITVKLDDDTGLRLYNEDTLANAYLKVAPFNPTIRYDETTRQYYYIVDNLTTAQTYSYSRHMGLPFYQTFDHYTFMVSLLLIPPFYYRVFGTKSLLDLFWKPLWISLDDDHFVQNRIIEKLGTPSSFSIKTAITILGGVKLKCNITKSIYSNLQRYYTA